MKGRPPFNDEAYAYHNPLFDPYEPENEHLMHSPIVEESKTVSAHNGLVVFYAPCYCSMNDCAGFFCAIRAINPPVEVPRNILSWSRIELKFG